MLRRKSLAIVLLSALGLTLAPKITAADDFAPPPWSRLHPNAVTAEWEFSAPANPTPPDGPLTNVLVKGSGTVPTSATITGGPAGLGWGVGDGDGGWFFPGAGDIRFTVDNVIDNEPVKHIWLQVTHTPGLGLAVDPLAGFNFGATGSLPGPVSTISHGPTSTIFFWDMFPNPPWEDFQLLVFGPGEIDQIVVDTISIPEPSSVVLCGIGLLTVGLVAQRRRRRGESLSR
jgi:hypothetical protein